MRSVKCKLLRSTKIAAVVASVFMLSACEFLPKVFQPAQEQNQVDVPQETVKSTDLCIDDVQQETFGKWCELDEYLRYSIQMSDKTWPERKAKIAELGEEPDQLVEKIILSQGTNTPYTDRLRAQNWILKVTPMLSEAMNIVLNSLVYENSKQLLEFESAITILSRVNARQEKTISELRAQLTTKEQEIQKQQNQVEQLLKIESDLVEQNRNEDR